jgi:hypothetical protein
MTRDISAHPPSLIFNSMTLPPWVMTAYDTFVRVLP